MLRKGFGVGPVNWLAESIHAWRVLKVQYVTFQRDLLA